MRATPPQSKNGAQSKNAAQSKNGAQSGNEAKTNPATNPAKERSGTTAGRIVLESPSAEGAHAEPKTRLAETGQRRQQDVARALSASERLARLEAFSAA